MTVAADTREAVRERPFLETALRAGGEQEAVAAALRRYADELDDYEETDRRASVSMKSGVGVVDEEGESASNALLRIGETAFTADGGDYTAVIADGDVDPTALADVLGRLRTAEVEVEAAGATAGTLAVVVDRRAGANAVRAVEDAL
jgi:hypothetical protein